MDQEEKERLGGGWRHVITKQTPEAVISSLTHHAGSLNTVTTSSL